MNKILLLLKNNDKHKEYNKRLMEYLNERHEYLNDNGFFIDIDIVNDLNLDDYVKKGVQSIPALIVDDTDIDHGVNGIICKLSKLEIENNNDDIHEPFVSNQSSMQPTASKPISTKSNYTKSEATVPVDENAFYEISMKEMLDIEGQEEYEGTSTVSIKNQSVETPMDDKYIASKRETFDAMMNERKKLNKTANKHIPRGRKDKLDQKNLNDVFKKEDYDKGESLFMKQIIENMNS